MAEIRHVIPRPLVERRDVLRRAPPDFVYRFRELAQAFPRPVVVLVLPLLVRERKGLLPLLEPFVNLVADDPLYDLVEGDRHALVGNEEMPDGVLREFFAEADILSRPIAERDLATATDYRVSALELGAEPRDVRLVAVLSGRQPLAADGTEPERDFREVCGGRVQVNAEDVVVRNHHLDAGLLSRILLNRDGALQLPLLLLEVDVGKLVDGLVQERGRSHRRLAHGKLHHLVRRHVIRDALFEGETHETAREDFRRIV